MAKAAFKRANESQVSPEEIRFRVDQFEVQRGDGIAIFDTQTGRHVPATYRTGFHASFVGEMVKLADLLNSLHEQTLDNDSGT